MNSRGNSFKVISNARTHVCLLDTNMKKLQRYQRRLQETRGLKVSVNAIINECVHNYLKDEV